MKLAQLGRTLGRQVIMPIESEARILPWNRYKEARPGA
jgi:hypothetical protein